MLSLDEVKRQNDLLNEMYALDEDPKVWLKKELGETD